MSTIMYLVGGRFKSAEEARRRENIANSFLANSQSNRVIMEEVGYGPCAIESCAEGEISIAGTLKKALQDSDGGRMDAIVVGGGDDPGLYSLRQLMDMPVVGLTETSCAFASILGEKFSMITTSEESVPETRVLFRKYGVLDKCASIRYLNFSVLDMQRGVISRQDVVKRFIEQVELARQDGAASVIMGCGTMAFLLLDEAANEVASIPVINPAKVAIRAAEALLSMGLRHSDKAYPKPSDMRRIRVMLS